MSWFLSQSPQGSTGQRNGMTCSRPLADCKRTQCSGLPVLLTEPLSVSSIFEKYLTVLRKKKRCCFNPMCQAFHWLLARVALMWFCSISNRGAQDMGTHFLLQLSFYWAIVSPCWQWVTWNSLKEEQRQKADIHTHISCLIINRPFTLVLTCFKKGLITEGVGWVIW